MSNPERKVKGIWIPIEVWEASELSLTDKVLLAEIDSLSDSENPCFASNAYFAEFFNVTETRISECLTKLKRLGYVEQVGFDGRTRLLKCSLPTAKDGVRLQEKTESDSKKRRSPTPRKDGVYNIANNINDNIANNSGKSTSKLFSIEKNKTAKINKWLEDSIKIALGYNFSIDVQNELAEFLANLAEVNSLLPARSLISQLKKLQQCSNDSQRIDAVQKTVSRGWKSLEYAIDEVVKQSKASFDTATNSTNQLHSDQEKKTRRSGQYF